MWLCAPPRIRRTCCTAVMNKDEACSSTPTLWDSHPGSRQRARVGAIPQSPPRCLCLAAFTYYLLLITCYFPQATGRRHPESTGTTPPATDIAAVLHGHHLRVACPRPSTHELSKTRRRLRPSRTSTLVFRTAASVASLHTSCDFSNLPSHLGNLAKPRGKLVCHPGRSESAAADERSRRACPERA